MQEDGPPRSQNPDEMDLSQMIESMKSAVCTDSPLKFAIAKAENGLTLLMIYSPVRRSETAARPAVTQFQQNIQAKLKRHEQPPPASARPIRERCRSQQCTYLCDNFDLR